MNFLLIPVFAFMAIAAYLWEMLKQAVPYFLFHR